MTTVHLTAVGAAMGRKRVQDMNMIFAIKAIVARAAWAGARLLHGRAACPHAAMRGCGPLVERSLPSNASFARMCCGRGPAALSVATVFLFVVSFANAADYPPSCFTRMGNDRVLLMNNDNNAQCPITLQSYYDTNTAATTYWTHAGDPAPTGYQGSENMSLLNLKDGTHHILLSLIHI